MLLQWFERHIKLLNDKFIETLDDLAATVVTNMETGSKRAGRPY